MKKILLLGLVLMVLVFGCTEEAMLDEMDESLNGAQDAVNGEETDDEDTDEGAEDEENDLEEKDMSSCEYKAEELVPETITMTLTYYRDPDTEAWTIQEGQTFTDGTPFKLRGTIDGFKGKQTGENTNYYYIKNQRNEKLYGAGGIQYLTEEVINGVKTENEFIVKPVLEAISIIEPETPGDLYVGEFDIVDENVVKCALS